MFSTELSCLLGLLVMGNLAWNTKTPLEQSFHDLLPVTGDLMEQFKAFQIQYNKSYPDPAEQKRRFDIFADNLAKAQRLTEEHGGLTQFGVTQFSDLTEEEFRQLFQMPQPSYSDPRLKMGGHPRLKKLQSRSCNWMKAGVLSPVKYQGGCISSWAISAVDNVEALWAIMYQEHFILSVQEVLDCHVFAENCKGGSLWNAFITIYNEGGLAKETDYPYKARPSNCFRNMTKWATIQGFLMLPNEEDYMAQYLVKKGPITVHINGNLLQHYREGVIKPNGNCDPKDVNHPVLLVGFSKNRDFPYWILRNSWGKDWGEQGYFRLHLGSNACGISRYPITALLGEGHGPRMRCPS